MCASFVLNNVTRPQGRAVMAMIGLTAGGIFNIILDPLFIFTFQMGVGGAALATVVSQCISFHILLSFYLGKSSIISLSPKYLSRKLSDYGPIIKTGLPTVFRQGLGSLSTTLLNVQVKVYGDAAIAAVGIANKIYMLLRSFVLGIGHGFQPVAGYNYGAKKPDQVKKPSGPRRWAPLWLGFVRHFCCCTPTRSLPFSTRKRRKLCGSAAGC